MRKWKHRIGNLPKRHWWSQDLKPGYLGPGHSYGRLHYTSPVYMHLRFIVVQSIPFSTIKCIC